MPLTSHRNTQIAPHKHHHKQSTLLFCHIDFSINTDDTKPAAATMNSCEEMTMDEIFNGKGKYYPGLIPLVYAYLDYIRCVTMPCLALPCLAATSCHVKSCHAMVHHLRLRFDCIMFWQQDILYYTLTVLCYTVLRHPVLNNSTTTLECTHKLINISTLVSVLIIDVTQKPSRE